MSRLLSCALTEDAVIERRKTVTRRLGWKGLAPGDTLTLVRKSMGRHNRRTGVTEPLVRLAEVQVVGVRRERLDAITDDDVTREGLTPEDLQPYVEANRAHRPDPADGLLADAFVTFFVGSMRCRPETEVTRIEWVYLSDPPRWTEDVLL